MTLRNRDTTRDTTGDTTGDTTCDTTCDTTGDTIGCVPVSATVPPESPRVAIQLDDETEYLVDSIECYGASGSDLSERVPTWPYSLVDRMNRRVAQEDRPWLRPDREFVAACRKVDASNGFPWIDLQFRPNPRMPPWRDDLEQWAEQHKSARVEEMGRTARSPSVRQYHGRPVRLTLRLPHDVHECLTARSAETGMSINTTVLLLLQRALGKS